MAYSRQRAVSDGTLQRLDVAISYIRRADINVLLDGVRTDDWAWAGNSDAIQFPSPIPNGVEVTIVRSTQSDKVIHEFAKGAKFVNTSVDQDFRQMLYLAQEYTEGAGVSDFYSDLDMHGFAIRNLGDATLPSDAVNLQQLNAAVFNTDVSQLRAELAAATGPETIGFSQLNADFYQTLQGKVRRRYDLEDYGVVGVGGDDTEVVSSALAKIPEGATLEFPPRKVIRISATLAPKAYTTLSLNRCTILQLPGSNLSSLVFVGVNSPGVYLRNGALDVNVSRQVYVQAKGDTGRGVFAYNNNGLRCHNIAVRSPYGAMILAAGSANIKLRQCDINDAQGTGHAGIEFNTCTDCDVYDSTGLGKEGVSGYGVYAHGPCSRIRIIGNSMQYWQLVCIGVDYISPGSPIGAQSTMLFCRIDGNTLIRPSADTSIHMGRFGSVSNNIIIESRDVGISMDYSRNCTVNDNVIHTTNASGIALPGCIDMTVTDNMLSNCGSQWVHPVDNGQRCGIWVPSRFSETSPVIYPTGNVITGNTIRDTIGNPQMWFGISLAGNPAGTNVNYVSQNYITGSLGGDLDIPKQTNIGVGQEKKYPLLLNGWKNSGLPYGSLSFYKDDLGTVFLDGLIVGGAVGTVIAQLPAGHRPPNQKALLVLTDTGTGRLDVFPDGSIVYVRGSLGYVSLTGLVFSVR